MNQPINLCLCRSMKMCWTKAEECTEEWRINYREMMFTTPGLSGTTTKNCGS